MRDADPKQRWRRVQDLFHGAIELEPASRRAYLEQHCAEDDGLLADVEGLLEDALPDPSGPRPDPPDEDLSGLELGPYRLVRVIGRGSMGVVYEARQRWVERAVALKVLRPRGELAAGGSSEASARLARRFLAEAEILGLLDHPGIVPIHAFERAGEHTYFTMRLVRGEDFRQGIARVHAGVGGWGLHRALGIVLRVCETMAFAHDRGVLHRDLKPAHVMVGAFGEVYVVDWGLARLSARPETPSEVERIRPAGAAARSGMPLRTADGEVIGTPAYMPPEQARGELARLDARSDVYAVGAMLYHLLVGRPPYLGPQERVAGEVVLERVLSGPPPPIRTLLPAVAPALAAIAEKAMRREPAERYANMQDLAGDLQAFLENGVVGAHRTGAMAGALKWLQRNRLVAGAAGLVLLLALGWGLTAIAMQRSTNRVLARAVEETRAERDRARRQAAIAAAATVFLEDMFRSLHPGEAQGEAVTVRSALDRAAARVDATLAGEPEVEASVRTTLGLAYHQLGLLAEAERHLARARLLREERSGAPLRERLLALRDHGAVLGDLARHAEAREALQASLEGLRSSSGPGAAETLDAQARLAQVLFDAECPAEAETLARELLVLADPAGASEPLLVALEVLGALHYRRDELLEAEALFRRQLELDRLLFGAEHSSTAIATANLAMVLDALGRHEEAFALGAEALERFRRVFGAEHPNTLSALANTGIQAFNLGRSEEGIQRLTEALELERATSGASHPRTATALYNLAELLRRAARPLEAVPLFEELLAWQRGRLDPDHADLRRCLHGLADCLMGIEAWEAAAVVLGELLPIERRNAAGPLSNPEATEARLRRCWVELGRSAGSAEPDSESGR